MLRDIHQGSAQAVNLWQYFAVQSMEEMLYLELVEMVNAVSALSAAGCVTAILFWSISASGIIAIGFIRAAAPASSLAQS